MKAALEVNGIKGIIAFQPAWGYGKYNVTAYEKSVARCLREDEKSDRLAQIALARPQAGSQVGGLFPAAVRVRTYDLTELFEVTGTADI